MFKAIQQGFNNISKNIEGAVRGTVVGNAATGGDGWNIGGGGGESTQTTTQQNLPDWAIPAAMGTLSMGDYYTMNPNYRPSTLDRDYSGIRGYNAEGQPNSQVGQFGLSPMPAQPQPQPQPQPERGAGIPTGGLFGSGLFGGLKGQVAIPTSGLFGGGFGGVKGQVSGQSPMPAQPQRAQNGGNNQISAPDNSIDLDRLLAKGTGLKMDDAFFGTGRGPGRSAADTTNDNTATATKSTIDPNDNSSQGNLTPFPAYDRQRFAAPGENTLRGEGILAGRYNQRFGPGGTDPFAAATTAVDKAANYGSTYTGTTGLNQNGEPLIGSQAGGYQAGLATARDPGIFSGSTDYKTGLDTKFSNPNAGMGNVNSGLQNVNAGLQNVNAGLQSATYGNANQGLQGPINYQQGKTLRDSMQQFLDPYTDRVVNQTIQDMDRARQMTANQISGDAAKAGAFGGSREALMRAENNRNFADRTAAAVGQLRSQGFQRAADLAQQENLQRLGLSASDVQQARGLQSQGNLQGQNLTANDLQNVRALQSQGALAAQGLQSQGALAAQALQSQGALTAQGLRSQGALAALNANANLYGQGVNLGAGLDQAALQANAGLLSDAMKLDAADLQQRRDIASAEAQFAESANRGAGALNLQGGTALGDLAQAGIGDERQRIADMLASGQAGDARNQQDLDFIYGEFNRELAYPGQQIDLRNAAISPATGSIVTTTQPRYEQNPLVSAIGAGVGAYGMTQNPYLALLAGGAGLLSS